VDLKWAPPNADSKPSDGEMKGNAPARDTKGLIREQVIHTLGEPAGLHKVQGRRLGEDHYRVNVLAGPDAASAKTVNSYFLRSDRDGKIIASNPKLAKGS
jgi:hypothetical protein